jgi:hypothetical protein
MQKKRGQITLFIIIGVIITSLIIGGIYVNSSIKEKASRTYFQKEGVKEELSLLKKNINHCLEDLSINSLNTIGEQGGYYTKPKKHYSLKEKNYTNYAEFISYYYYEGEIIIPRLKDIEYELSNYVTERFTQCLKENTYSFDIKQEMKTNVIINPSKVDYSLEGYIILKSEEGHNTKIDLKDYSKIYNIKLFEIYEITQYLTESHKESPNSYCVNCIIDMLEERNLYLDYYPIDEYNMVVKIKDKENTLNQEFNFIYLNKYTGNEQTEIIEQYETLPIPEPQV